MPKKFNLENNEILKQDLENELFNEITKPQENKTSKNNNKTIMFNLEQKEIKTHRVFLILKESSYIKLKKYAKNNKISINELVNQIADSLQ